MIMPCEFKADCPPELLTNYTAEGAEPFPPFPSIVIDHFVPPPPDTFQAPGCVGLCFSFISQEDADLCALRQAILCTEPPGGGGGDFSAPAQCSVSCPDGTIFTYFVPYGVFFASSVAQANEQAMEYACQQAASQRVCLGPIPRCTCVGSEYEALITADPSQTGLTFAVVGGTFPPGLTLNGFGTHATISGTPLTPGTFVFVVRATTANGATAEKTYAITALFISTTSLPDFAVGVAYSKQMVATGGSGNYAWAIVTGSLPDGLSMTSAGLISGTPTASGGGSLEFSVVDTTCEQAERSFIRPRVNLVTVASNVFKTRRGFPEFTPFDGTLYRRATYEGFYRQFTFTYAAGTPCGGGCYIYDGYSEIDINGNVTARHTRNLFAMCTNTFYWPELRPSTPNIGSCIGFCWAPDAASCPTCPTGPNPNSTDDPAGNWPLVGNYAQFGSNDFPFQNMYKLPTAFSPNPFTRIFPITTSAFIIQYIAPVSSIPSFPFSDVGINGNRQHVRSFSQGEWSTVLSIPYTDADAEATKVTFTNNGNVAQNFPSYGLSTLNNVTRATALLTTVNYSLVFTNLVAGEEYVAHVDLFNQATGTVTTLDFAFTATGTTHSIDGTVPTPSAGSTITVRNANVAFA